jgi:dTDP-4-amino-4,6-dideoxygalactose transaminase
MEIKFSPPDISALEIENVVSVLKSGWITSGEKVLEFEKKLYEYMDTPRTVCLNSATAALELTLRVLGIGPGDEVITSAYTYTATASAIAHVGAKIVLVDVEKDSFKIDPLAVNAVVTEKTKAVIPVDFAGVISRYDNIFAIAEEKKTIFRPDNALQKALGRIAVIADAAQSFGSEQKQKRSGAIADFSCFSFHAVKNLTTAEGGAVTWRYNPAIDDDALYRSYKLYSLHGQTANAFEKAMQDRWSYDIELLGYKYNMTDITAALGLAQLARYDEMLARKRSIAKRYDTGFLGRKIRPLRHFSDDFVSNAHLYVTQIEDAEETERDEIIRSLSKAGIPTNVHFKPLPMFSGYQKLGFNIKNFQNAYAQYKNELTLPCHSLLTDDAVDYIIHTVNNLVY